jgi:hypothetical protein
MQLSAHIVRYTITHLNVIDDTKLDYKSYTLSSQYTLNFFTQEMKYTPLHSLQSIFVSSQSNQKAHSNREHAHLLPPHNLHQLRARASKYRRPGLLCSKHT